MLKDIRCGAPLTYINTKAYLAINNCNSNSFKDVLPEA